MRVILLRHGETAWNEDGRYQGWQDVPLSARGRATAETLRRWLPTRLTEPFELWSSDLARAVTTARLVFRREPRADRRIRELDFGEFSGRTYQENLTRFGPRFTSWLEHRGRPAPPGGETLEDFRRRTTAWLADVRAAGRTVVAVTHGGVIRTLVRPFEVEEHWPVNGEVVVLTFGDDDTAAITRWKVPTAETTP